MNRSEEGQEGRDGEGEGGGREVRRRKRDEGAKLIYIISWNVVATMILPRVILLSCNKSDVVMHSCTTYIAEHVCRKRSLQNKLYS